MAMFQTTSAGESWTVPDLLGSTGPSTIRKDWREISSVYAVGEMCGLLERELKSRASISIRWGSKVTAIKSGLASEDDHAVVEVEENGQTKEYSADHIVGTDGGNSTVRRLVFGSRKFPGFSWEEQIVATNVSWHYEALLLKVVFADFNACQRPRSI